jgi:hypothetical protein
MVKSLQRRSRQDICKESEFRSNVEREITSFADQKTYKLEEKNTFILQLVRATMCSESTCIEVLEEVRILLQKYILNIKFD